MFYFIHLFQALWGTVAAPLVSAWGTVAAPFWFVPPDFGFAFPRFWLNNFAFCFTELLLQIT